MTFFHPNHSIMQTETMDNIIDREKLQDRYIRADIDAMDLDDMYTILYDLFDEKLSTVSDEELMKDVKEYHPDLLEE